MAIYLEVERIVLVGESIDPKYKLICKGDTQNGKDFVIKHEFSPIHHLQRSASILYNSSIIILSPLCVYTELKVNITDKCRTWEQAISMDFMKRIFDIKPYDGNSQSLPQPIVRFLLHTFGIKKGNKILPLSSLIAQNQSEVIAEPQRRYLEGDEEDKDLLF